MNESVKLRCKTRVHEWKKSAQRVPSCNVIVSHPVTAASLGLIAGHGRNACTENRDKTVPASTSIAGLGHSTPTRADASLRGLFVSVGVGALALPVQLHCRSTDWTLFSVLLMARD